MVQFLVHQRNAQLGPMVAKRTAEPLRVKDDNIAIGYARLKRNRTFDVRIAPSKEASYLIVNTAEPHHD
jgi:hypothetical protein